MREMEDFTRCWQLNSWRTVMAERVPITQQLATACGPPARDVLRRWGEAKT